jgi:hypothetical protein
MCGVPMAVPFMAAPFILFVPVLIEVIGVGISDVDVAMFR